MQLGHLKEVVQNISDGTQLEFQLQRCQEEQGVVILDIYNTEWGSCKALGETFKRLYTDFGNEIDIRFFSVECDTIMKKMDQSSVGKKKHPHKAIEYYEDTKSSFWESILQSRCGHSKPYFVLYKEGRMRNHIEGVDTPNICKLISSLCGPDPIIQCLKNPDGLKFWKEHFPVTKSEIPFTSFIEAVEKNLDLALTPQKILLLKDAIGAENGICTAIGLQLWMNDMTLSECIDKIVSAPDNPTSEKGADVKDIDDPRNESPSGLLSHPRTMEKRPDEETGEIRRTELSPQESQMRLPPAVDENEREQESQTVEKDYSSRDNIILGAESQADQEGSGAAMAMVDTPQNPGNMNQIFIDRWITVSDDELIVWNKIADLPLHYPPLSTAPLDTTCEEAAQKAWDHIINAKNIPTLAGYLQERGLTDLQINMMCLAAHHKVGSEIPSYGKLALILMTSHRDELVGLLPEPTELVSELAKGVLLDTNGPVGFTVLCLCGSEAFPDEAFFYIPPPPLGDRLNQLNVRDELPLPALTPLQTNNPPEDSLSMKIIGLPKVIELASTEEAECIVVLSQWFTKLRIVDKTENVVTAEFVELLFEKEYMNFLNTYAERLVQDENRLQRNLGDKNSTDMEKNSN